MPTVFRGNFPSCFFYFHRISSFHLPNFDREIEITIVAFQFHSQHNNFVILIHCNFTATFHEQQEYSIGKMRIASLNLTAVVGVKL